MPLSTTQKSIEENFLGVMQDEALNGVENNMHSTLLRDISIKAVTDPDKALAASQYYYSRSAIIRGWAKSQNSQMSQMVEEFETVNQEVENGMERINEIQKKLGLIRRMLIYRSIVAMETALKTLQDTEAQKDLAALRSCEATPF